MVVIEDLTFISNDIDIFLDKSIFIQGRDGSGRTTIFNYIYDIIKNKINETIFYCPNYYEFLDIIKENKTRYSPYIKNENNVIRSNKEVELFYNKINEITESLDLLINKDRHVLVVIEGFVGLNLKKKFISKNITCIYIENFVYPNMPDMDIHICTDIYVFDKFMTMLNIEVKKVNYNKMIVYINDNEYIINYNDKDHNKIVFINSKLYYIKAPASFVPNYDTI